MERFGVRLMPGETACGAACRMIRNAAVAFGGKDTTARAATWLATCHVPLCREVMETIGDWPSSDPELRALQRAWDRSGKYRTDMARAYTEYERERHHAEEYEWRAAVGGKVCT